MRPVERAEREGARPFAAGLCCPYCSAALVARGAGLFCPGEERFFAGTGGVYRLLDEERRAPLRPALEMEHRLRRDEGFAAEPGLPEVKASHPRASLWRGRARRFHEGYARASELLGPGPWRVLEVGAGCAWAGAALAVRGHDVTALDASLDPHDGLPAALRLLPPGVHLERVEADMEALPLEPGLFDLVVAVDALHYAREVQRMLVELRRVTRRGGALLVLETPVYARREDGEADIVRRMRRLRRRYGMALPRELQPGYLVRDELPLLFSQAGYLLETARPRRLRAFLLDLAAVLLGRAGLPARPLLFARRDG